METAFFSLIKLSYPPANVHIRKIIRTLNNCTVIIRNLGEKKVDDDLTVIINRVQKPIAILKVRVNPAIKQKAAMLLDRECRIN